MTDRYNALTVVLEHNAIRQLRGVLSVSGNVSDLGDHIAQERARHDLGEKLWRVLYPKTASA